MDNIVVIDSTTMGVGDEILGKKLLKTFLTLLCERHEKPRTVIFYNSGVKLACEGSDVLDLLRHLESDDVEILLCGTCLDYYNLREKTQVGTISNMGTIQERMLWGKTIKP
jgi:selenium metabolism protein YedF